MPATTALQPAQKRSAMAAALLGIGVMAAVDEIIFHQILAWHHFYDGATPLVGLMTDGLLHTGELIALVAGSFLAMQLLKRQRFQRGYAWAGFFIGMGGFQLLDGLLNHKVLRLHQIRYGVNSVLPYDLAWNGFALALLGIGWLLWRRARSEVAA